MIISRIIVLCITVLLVIGQPVSASAFSIDAKGFINGQNIDSANNRGGAINITNPNVGFSWQTKNLGSKTINLSKVLVDYSTFLPSKEFEFNSTIKPGGTENHSIAATLPDWVLKLKGYYNISIYLYDDSNNVVLTRSFWVLLGAGNPLTGVIGGTGVALGVIAVGSGVASAAAASQVPKPPTSPGEATDPKPRKRGRLTRGLSSALMFFASALIMIALGIYPPGGLFMTVGAAFAAGISENILVRLLTMVFRLGTR